MRLTMTLELARAAGQDAANASMRDAGRTSWSEEDYNVAVATMNRLMPDPSPIDLCNPPNLSTY
jgi:hypothetical protein